MSFTLWRGVVGMVRPTRRPGTLEELIRILPEGIGVVPLLLNFKAGSNAEFLDSIPLYERFAAELAEQGVDVIMLTGAPPFMLLGPEDEAKLTDEWEKKFKTPIVPKVVTNKEAAADQLREVDRSYPPDRRRAASRHS